MELCHELLNNIHRPVTLLQLFISFLNKILGTSGFFCDAADPIGRLFYHGIDICYGTADLTDMFLQFFHCVFGFLHNIPEGMAVGVVYAGYRLGNSGITAAGALALSLGIAIQNFPEGAIISMPLRAEGMKKSKAFAGGVLSGIVEPIGAVLTILASGFIVPVLPYLLSFAAGAMLYVVVEELIPEMSQGEHSNLGTIFFAVGFSIMMILDVALG